MPRFQQRPVIVEANQFLPDSDDWPIGVKEHGEGWWVVWDVVQNRYVRVNAGDWIIVEIKGARYPCSDEVFRANYEPVPVEG